MAQGRVHWYSANLGHGFIFPEEGGPMVFVRRKDIVAGEEKNIENNDKVSYEVAKGREGLEARHLSRV